VIEGKANQVGTIAIPCRSNIQFQGAFLDHLCHSNP
jgi:hypothetical protein